MRSLLRLIPFFLFHFIVINSPAQNIDLALFEEDVRFKVDDVIISGSLALPDSDGPYPVIILVSGSWYDNRDAEYDGFKPFQILAGLHPIISLKQLSLTKFSQLLLFPYKLL